MFCENCKIEKKDSDFVNSKKLCFRCEYQEKLKKAPKKRGKPRPSLCRMCNGEIVHPKDSKNNPRTVFCSLYCAKLGQKTANALYWKRNILMEG